MIVIYAQSRRVHDDISLFWLLTEDEVMKRRNLLERHHKCGMVRRTGAKSFAEIGLVLQLSTKRIHFAVVLSLEAQDQQYITVAKEFKVDHMTHTEYVRRIVKIRHIHDLLKTKKELLYNYEH